MLRHATEQLARELARPSKVAPPWSPGQWSVAQAVAVLQGISPLLATGLQWQVPSPWREFLQEQCAHTAKRHARINALLDTVSRASKQAEVPFVALKGCALHGAGIYRPGERPMADIDLLVAPVNLKRMESVLLHVGLKAAHRTWKDQTYLPVMQHRPAPLGEHADNDVKIELHHRIGEKLPVSVVDITPRIFAPAPAPGLNAYASKGALMAHLLLHAAGTMQVKTLRLIQLLDISRLAESMSDEDWQHSLSSNAQISWWTYPPLRMTAEYFNNIPMSVLTRARAACPVLLANCAERARLYDVSLSYLWVNAFPGIVWARSCREALLYGATRVRPSAQLIEQRRILAAEQSWAADSSWSKTSQMRRTLRWVFSRTMRPVTVSVLRQVLGEQVAS